MYYEDVKTIRSPSISPDIYTSGSHHSFYRTTSISQVTSYSRSHSRSRSMSPGFSESHHSLYRTSSSSQITTIRNSDIRMNSGTIQRQSRYTMHYEGIRVSSQSRTSQSRSRSGSRSHSQSRSSYQCSTSEYIDSSLHGGEFSNGIENPVMLPYSYNPITVSTAY